MYLCDICHESPGIKDRWALVYTDKKDRAQFKGHKKCIDELQSNFQAKRKEIIRGRKTLPVQEWMEAMGYDIEDYRVDY